MQSCFISLPMNWAPWSDKMTNGRAVRLKIETNPSATAAVEMDRSGTASGHLVDIQIAVSTKRAPPLPLGRGPTKSIVSCSNGLAYLPWAPYEQMPCYKLGKLNRTCNSPSLPWPTQTFSSTSIGLSYGPNALPHHGLPSTTVP